VSRVLRANVRTLKTYKDLKKLKIHDKPKDLKTSKLILKPRFLSALVKALLPNNLQIIMVIG